MGESTRESGPRRWILGIAALAALGLVVWLVAKSRSEPIRDSGAATSEPAAASKEIAVETRDLVLITIDTLRADSLGYVGARPVETPAIDALARSGIVFPRAHAHTVTTLPSHANILTGRLPFEHGVRANGLFTLPTGIPTLATILADRGFATAAFVAAYPLDSRFGLDRGFSVYDDELPSLGAGVAMTYPERSAERVVERASAWWRGQDESRRFLWIHLFEPHAPYEPPEPFRTEYRDAPYLGEVAAADRALAPLLDLVKASDALVVLTSDHGESLGEHGEETHGLFAYEPTLAVPLILWAPGLPGGTDERWARHVDLLPTALDALGIDLPANLPGHSLLGPPAAAGTQTYFEALSGHFDLGAAPLRGAIRDGQKLVSLPLPELYDLREDPGETRNLFAESRGLAREIEASLPGESEWPPEAGEADPETLRELRSLGYLGGTAAGKETYGPEDDPKRLAEIDRRLQRVLRLQAAGGLEEAIRLAREVIRERPDIPLAWSYLSDLHLVRGEIRAALETMLAARNRGVAGPDLLEQLALTLVQAGRPGEALEVLAPLTAEGGRPEALVTEGLALAATGRPEEGVERLERALASDPENPRAHETLAFVELGRGRAEAAEGHARRAAELAPTRPDAWNNLGLALYELGRRAEALDAWREAVRLDPGAYDTLFNLGMVAAEAGDATTARRALEAYLRTAPEATRAAERGHARDLLSRLP